MILVLAKHYKPVRICRAREGKTVRLARERHKNTVSIRIASYDSALTIPAFGFLAVRRRLCRRDQSTQLSYVTMHATSSCTFHNLCGIIIDHASTALQQNLRNLHACFNRSDPNSRPFIHIVLITLPSSFHPLRIIPNVSNHLRGQHIGTAFTDSGSPVNSPVQ